MSHVCVWRWLSMNWMHESAFLRGHLLCTKASITREYLFHHIQSRCTWRSVSLTHGRGQISSEDRSARTSSIQHATCVVAVFIIPIISVIVLIVCANRFSAFKSYSLTIHIHTYSLWGRSGAITLVRDSRPNCQSYNAAAKQREHLTQYNENVCPTIIKNYLNAYTELTS